MKPRFAQEGIHVGLVAAIGNAQGKVEIHGPQGIKGHAEGLHVDIEAPGTDQHQALIPEAGRFEGRHELAQNVVITFCLEFHAPYSQSFEGLHDGPSLGHALGALFHERGHLVYTPVRGRAEIDILVTPACEVAAQVDVFRTAARQPPQGSLGDMEKPAHHLVVLRLVELAILIEDALDDQWFVPYI